MSIFFEKYSKYIPDDHFWFARSCIRQNFFPGAEQRFLKIMREKLKKDVYDSPHHTTCTGIGYHTDIVHFETIMTVIARQFALMTEDGYENIAISCVTSFGIYQDVLEKWEVEPDLLEKARRYLKEATGREFKLPKAAVHTSDIIFKFRHEIASQLKYPLINKLTGEPLRVVDHVGCHYAKMFPSKGIGGAEYPYVLAGLVEAWGGESIDYPERRHCCGFGFRNYIVKADRGYSLTHSRIKFESMYPFKPDLILTNCPGCNMFMDRWQYVIAETEGKTYGDTPGYGIPVLTFEELTALVLGYDPWEIGLQMHQVPVEPLLRKMGIDFDPAGRYYGPDGTFLGKPEKPSFLKIE